VDATQLTQALRAARFRQALRLDLAPFNTIVVWSRSG
jgi:hypothetical protein